MKLIIVFSVVLGYAICQNIHGHDLKTLIDNGFARLDTNHDGILENSEYEAVLKADDTNGDGSISCDEYVAHSSAPRALALEIFHHIDGGDSDCLLTHQEALAALAHMDQNGDGRVVLHEFEHFYTQILKHLGHIPNTGK